MKIMYKNTRRLFSVLLVLVLVLSMLPAAAFTAAAASGGRADPRDSDDLWKTALLKGYTTYNVPYNANNSTTEYWADQWTGGSHLQGVAVDDDMRYLYTAYGTGFGKIDLQTGEVVGYIKGVGSSLHAGCMAYYDGYVYCALEVRAMLKCYIIQIDASKMSGAMTTVEDWEDAIRVILLDDVTSDIRDSVGDSVSNGSYAAYNEKLGHRYANAGFDGLTFGTYPGDAGKDDADIYMMLTYGTYYWGNNPARFDDEHILIRAYNTKDFLYADSKYLLQLSNDASAPDGSGWAHTGTMDYDRDYALKAAKTLFVPTGNIEWGTQNMEYDRSTGDLWLRTYGGSSGGPANGKNFLIVDGSVMPTHEEVQLGQNIDLSKTTYGFVSEMSSEAKTAAQTAAKARALLYSNSSGNTTLSAWNTAPGTGENYEWASDQQWSANGYPMGDIPQMKCIHGDGSHTANDDVMAYMGYSNVLIDGTNLSGGDVGLVSLGNDYFYTCNGTTMQLYHFDNGTRSSWTAVTKDNLASFIEAEGLNDQPVQTLKADLAKKIARAEQFYPSQDKYSDSTWKVYTAALANAKAVYADTASTAADVQSAEDTLIQAEKDLREGLDELTADLNYAARLSDHMYTAQTWNALQTAAAAARTAVDSNAQQIKLDDVAGDLTAALDALTLDSEGLTSKDTAISSLTPAQTTEGTDTVLTYDLSGSTYHTFEGSATTAVTVYADGTKVWAGSGSFYIPVAGVRELKVVTADKTGFTGELKVYYSTTRVLNDLTINGMRIAGFDSSVTDYDYGLEPGSPIPTVGASTAYGYTVEVEQALQVPGVAYVRVYDSANGVTEYAIHFCYNSQVSDADPLLADITYLSDIPQKNADGSLNWWHDFKYLGLNCSYYNYSGSSRVFGDNTYNTLKSGNTDGIPLATSTGTLKFTKGLSIEATDHSPSGANSTMGDDVYKAKIVSDSGLSEYSRIEYNIEGKGYNTFKGTFGLYRYDHEKTDGTIRIYVDDKCVAAYNLINKVDPFEVVVDITGAKTFSIQIDPENVNQRPETVANNWCWGDIVYIGDARFITGSEDGEIFYVDDLTAAGQLPTEHDLKVYQLGTMSGVYVASGKTETYTHAIKIEPTDHSTTGTGPIDRMGDDVYKKLFTDADNLINYSRVKYDIEGKGFSRFRATFGNYKWDHQYTNMMLRIYVDDKLVLEQASSGTVTPFDIDINVQGAKTLTIQVDPENIYGTKAGVDTNWCWGDIMYLGSARFLKSADSLDDYTPIPHECDFSKGTVVEPTCSAYGYTISICPTCGVYRKTNPTEKLAHEFTKLVVDQQYLAEAATCTQQAKYYLLCSACGAKGNETATDTNGALAAHVYEQEVVHDKYLKTAATHDAPAVYYKSCTCGDFDSSGTAATFTFGSCTEHVYYMEVADAKYLKSAATCESPAVYYKSCSCGAFITGGTAQTFTYGQLADHSFTQQVVDAKYLAEAANCTYHAKYYRSCVCGAAGNEIFTDENGKLGDHIPVIDAYVAPTYTTTGLTEGSHCDVCQEVFTAQQVIPVLTDKQEHTHSYGTAWKSDKDGHWKECGCGDKTQAAAHSFKWVVDQEATASEKGSRHAECETCGYKGTVEEIPASGSAANSSPNTGDSGMLGLWSLTAVASLAFGVWILASQKRRTVR